MMVACIDCHRATLGVESICRTIKGICMVAGGPIYTDSIGFLCHGQELLKAVINTDHAKLGLFVKGPAQIVYPVGIVSQKLHDSKDVVFWIVYRI